MISFTEPTGQLMRILHIYLLQKYGDKIDISLLKWGGYYETGLRDGGTVTINGKTLTCYPW